MRKLLLGFLLGFYITASAQDGTWDATFNIGTGAGAPVNGIEVLADGKIIIAGQFQHYNGATVNGLARLNANGDLDTSFTSPATAQNIFRTHIDDDGKIVYATVYSGSILKRVNADGSADDSFTPPDFSFDAEIVSISKQGEKYIVSGSFTVSDGITQLRNIVRLDADGTLDASFAPVVLYSENTSYAITHVLPDDKIIAAGRFEFYDEVAVANVIRLNADGTLDTSFNAGTGVQGQTRAIALQPDGKIILAGSFLSVNNVARNLIARLNSDGSMDESFVTPAGDGVTAFDLMVQPDGKIIAGGNFQDSEVIIGGDDDSVPVYIKRFNADGTLDATFASEESADNQVWCLALQDDGKLLAGGWFETVAGVTKNRLARLNNTLLSVKSYQPLLLSVYPNPVADKLTVNVATFTAATAKITVCDVTGKTIYNAQQPTTGTIVVDMSGYYSGLYFVNVIAGDKTLTQKVIKN